MLRSDMHQPNKAMQSAAIRGIQLHKDFRRGGTSVGMGTARSLANLSELDLDKIKQMYSFFIRHEVDARPGWDDPTDPSNGWIAHLLWGGDAGKEWSTGIRERAIQAKVWFAAPMFR